MTVEKMEPLNVRVPQALRSLIEEAAQVSECSSLSDWLREALEAAATQEIVVHARLTRATLTDPGPAPNHPRVHVTGVHATSLGRVTSSGCTHPPTARRDLVDRVVCGLCGATVRRRI